MSQRHLHLLSSLCICVSMHVGLCIHRKTAFIVISLRLPKDFSNRDHQEQITFTPCFLLNSFQMSVIIYFPFLPQGKIGFYFDSFNPSPFQASFQYFCILLSSAVCSLWFKLLSLFMSTPHILVQTKAHTELCCKLQKRKKMSGRDCKTERESKIKKYIWGDTRRNISTVLTTKMLGLWMCKSAIKPQKKLQRGCS